MKIKPIKTRVFKEGEDLPAFISRYVKKLSEKSVIVITSKIAALSERRTAIIENGKTKEKIIREESEIAIPTKYVWLTVKDGMAMASAGIDESNGNGKLILLPKNSFKTADGARRRLKNKFKVKKLGILITDSRSAPLRAGATGIALGYAGFEGIRDYRGKPDIFGRKFHFSKTNVADALSAAAVLVMGEGDEQRPLAVIEEAPIEFCERVNRRELRINIKDDIYRPLFLKLRKSKR